ncbi:hypothetical protein H4N54_01765 [Limnospira fusiformis KN01]|uniref:hypothetical protein n=2 Tax=Limnospira TaxID=2596745 RepID=UPI0016589054|nr:hypothetical protein [Limnospira fusiformis]ULB46153.1 hypothetical protein H4N54_01765 [Limnospira fusiformis KN01]
MSDLIVKIPDSLYQQVAELAARESISVDQWVAIAFSAQVSPWMTQDYVVEPAKRGNWEQFKQVLSKVPLVPPEEVVVRFLKWRSLHCQLEMRSQLSRIPNCYNRQGKPI